METYRVRASSFNANLSPKPPTSSQIFLPKPPTPSYLNRRLLIHDSELSIFDAQRYFNEGQHNPFNATTTSTTTNFPKKSTIILNGPTENCDSSTNPRDSSVSSSDGYAKSWRNRSFRATPTASSEASWNSQSGLLTHPQGNSVAVSVKAFPLNEKRLRNGSPSFTASRRLFRCNCYGKKSVDVEEKFSEPKSSPVRLSSDSTAKEVEPVAKLQISPGLWAKDTTHRIVNSGFSFPVLAPPPPVNHSSDVDDPARESLEVFRPADEVANLKRSVEFHRRIPSEIGTGDDDVASDTSSDLFEIESFSTTTNSGVYRRRDSLDEFPKLVANAPAPGILQFQRSIEESSECYAPSEVSVEWSVTTAEGGFDRSSVANFSSAASDYEETRFIIEPDRFKGNGGGNKKKGSGGLLSCKCENAVNVGPNPVRIGPEQRRPGPGAAVFAVEPERVSAMSRFAMESELVRSHSVQLNRPVQTR